MSNQTAVAQEVALRVVLGRRELPADAEAMLVGGRTLALNQGVEDPIEVFCRGHLVARGELLVRDDRYWVRVTEVIRDAPVS